MTAPADLAKRLREYAVPRTMSDEARKTLTAAAAELDRLAEERDALQSQLSRTSEYAIRVRGERDTAESIAGAARAYVAARGRLGDLSPYPSFDPTADAYAALVTACERVG